MAKLTIVYWRDIPAQVIVKQGRSHAKVILSERFEKAIDMAAMRGGESSTDDYLAHWRREVSECRADDLDEAAQSKASTLEAEYDEERLRQLIANGGQAG